jgi:hypothetical protein
MLEYGYLYNDPSIGVFRSRLSPEELKRADRERGKEAAKILDHFKDRNRYQEFLETYTPITDPFLHEARVHLFRRDEYFSASNKFKHDQEKYAWHLNIAYRENQIMEDYFPNLLRHSTYVWSDEDIALVKKYVLEDEIYDSKVSWWLITLYNDTHVAGFFALLLIGLALMHRYLGRNYIKR